MIVVVVVVRCNAPPGPGLVGEVFFFLENEFVGVRMEGGFAAASSPPGAGRSACTGAGALIGHPGAGTQDIDGNRNPKDTM